MKDIDLNIKKESNFIFETDGVLLNMMTGAAAMLGYYPRRKRPHHSEYHTHALYELFYVVDGALLVHFCDSKETVRVEKGQFLFVSPEVSHFTEIDPIEGAARYTFDFTFRIKKKTQTANRLCDLFSFPDYLKMPSDDFCRAQLEFFIRARTQNEETMAGCHFLSFLLGVYKALGKENMAGPPVFNDTEANRLYKIERLCSTFYAEGFPLSLLAEELHLSERQVERIIKKHYGCGFHALITSYRMKEAKLLLLKGVPVSAVAETVGYSSSSVFHRAFRNTFGVSPNEFVRSTATDVKEE